MTKKTYILEYWVDSSVYSKERLAQKLSENLQKLDIDCEITEERDYHVLEIRADKKKNDACHDHLKFNREDAFRAKDELGNELRLKAYPVLADIEIQLRRFITRAMIEVLGFNWWYLSTPKPIRENVSKIEKQSGSKQAEDHHQIEFTMFDELISFVTGKYQKWPDTKNITPLDLSELLNDCETIEELKQKLNHRRKQTSLWEEVFSNYFDDEKGWKKLESKIEDIVIPIRNKVMHHRLIRIHEVRQLKNCRDELNEILRTAKLELPKADLENALKNLQSAVVENIRFQIDTGIVKAINKNFIDPELIKSLQRSARIDREVMKGVISKINFGLQDSDDLDSYEDKEEESNGDEKSDQNEEGKS